MIRRNFLKNIVILGLGGKFLFNEIEDIIKNENKHFIFNELPKHVYLAEYSGDLDVNGRSKLIERIGAGIIVNGFYITMEHITNLGEVRSRSIFGNYVNNYEVNNYQVKLCEKSIDKIVLDGSRDIAIFDAKHIGLPNFPCKPSKNIKLGDEVYIIGNPRLTGTNIRKGIISDLDGSGMEDEIEHNKKYFFGTDIPVIGGDSGTPLVNSDFELIGLCSYYNGPLGYFSKIENFIK